MAELKETYACVPSTERGRGILISGDPRTDSIAYCNGRAVVIRRLDAPMDVSIYGEHGYPTTVARFSPNGEWVASADVSGTIRIWGRYGDRALKNEFRVLSGRIDDLQWSPDGLRIVASGDGKGKSFVRAFMWDSGSTVGDFDGHSRRVLSCAFKPTRPFRIVTCGEDFLLNFYEGPPFKFKLSQRFASKLSTIAKLLKCLIASDPSSCQSARHLDHFQPDQLGQQDFGIFLPSVFKENEHSNFVNCVRFSPDGSKFISVSSDKKGIIYDGKTGEKIGELSAEDGHKGSIYAVSWSPDGKQVITVSADKTAKVWEITEDGGGKLTRTLINSGSSGGVDDMLVGCLWQNDNLVTVSLGGTLTVFSATDPDKVPVSYSGHMKNISSLACILQSGQKVILSSSYDGIISRWIQGIGYVGKLVRKDTTQIKCFAALDEEIVTSAFDNKVWRVPLNGDQCGDTEPLDVGSQPKGLAVAAKTPELALVSTDSGVVLLQGSKVVSQIKLAYSVTTAAISPDGTEAIVGSEDGKLRIYSIKGDTLSEEAVLEKHRGAITAICYSPDASMFCSGDSNREAVVWDRFSREVKLNNMLYHTARINCLAWSPDSHLIATGSLDTCVIVYELDKPASSRITIKGAHLGGVYGIAFIDECSLASAGEDACVRVWTLTPQ